MGLARLDTYQPWLQPARPLNMGPPSYEKRWRSPQEQRVNVGFRDGGQRGRWLGIPVDFMVRSDHTKYRQLIQIIPPHFVKNIWWFCTVHGGARWNNICVVICVVRAGHLEEVMEGPGFLCEPPGGRFTQKYIEDFTASARACAQTFLCNFFHLRAN